MVEVDDIIQLSITKDEILSCIQYMQSKDFIDNLRNRSSKVRFDCMLRGCVGEYVIKKWFEQNGITVDARDYMIDEDLIDIDFLIAGSNIELKTSLLPDRDNDINDVINNEDIKIIRRNGQPIQQLKGDVHMQIYYHHKRMQREQSLEEGNETNVKNERNGEEKKIDLKTLDPKDIYSELKAEIYLDAIHFVAWIDKEALIQHIDWLESHNRKTCWSFAGSDRDFWVCKIKRSKPPKDLIGYLKNKMCKEFIFLPLYSLKAACGAFGDGKSVEREDVLKISGISGLKNNMFVVQAKGNSMEGKINDGDYCVFEWEGKYEEGTTVLVEHRDTFDNDYAGAYSIKNYTSSQSPNEDGIIETDKIILMPENHKCSPIEILPKDEGSYRIVGTFVKVLKRSDFESNMGCPECDGHLVERNGPYSKFYGCSNYPKCHYTRKL